MSKCKLCQKWFEDHPITSTDELGHVTHKTGEISWSSPHVCYFEDPENEWNCGTIGLIRELVYEGQDLPDGIDYQYCEDQKYATIKIDQVMVGDSYIGYALWLTWYKNRGATDQIFILDSSGVRKSTEEELVAIYNYYKTKGETSEKV